MPKQNTKKQRSSITPVPFKTKVGLNLKKIRKEFGISQTDLGKIIGVGSYQISRYEAGKDIMTIYVALKICAVLETTLDALVKDAK